MQTKRCGKCGKELSLDNFGKDSWQLSGYRSACRPCETERRRIGYLKNRDKRIASARKYQLKNMKKVLKRMSENNITRRELVIKKYGGKCSCCGESIKEFLTIEHPNKDGKIHRKTCGGSAGVIRDIIKKNFPKDYTILCCNCNYAERYGHKCPHKTANATK